VESTHTHAGNNKPLFYNENKDRFAKFTSKIIHIIVEDLPYTYPNIDITKNQQWENENFQRNAIQRGLAKLDLNDTDIFEICDLDEIPDPTILQKIKQNELTVTFNSLAMDIYYYNLNSKLNGTWNYAKIMSYKKYMELSVTCHTIRQYSIEKHNECPNIPGGWHLTYFGDKYFIQNKIQQFTHQEFNTNEYTSLDVIEERMRSTCDIYSRWYIYINKIPVNENTYLPPKYREYLNTFILY
jgi:beta-1,4-mannosyl-glycoprotein beta-1,4-N-acetylglucosaminyltransferase